MFEYIVSHIGIISDLLKALPGAILLIFSLFFSYRKIFDKVLIAYSTTSNILSETRITNIILVNKKDKPVIIYSIYATINEKDSLNIINYKIPIIIKPLESITIESNPVSFYLKNNQKYCPDFYSENTKITFYIISDKKAIKCKNITHPDYIKFKNFKKYNQISSVVKKFNDVTYNDQCFYAITYNFKGSQKTAIIMKNGLITGDWIMKENMLLSVNIESIQNVKNALDAIGLNKLVDSYSVDKLN